MNCPIQLGLSRVPLARGLEGDVGRRVVNHCGCTHLKFDHFGEASTQLNCIYNRNNNYIPKSDIQGRVATKT